MPLDDGAVPELQLLRIEGAVLVMRAIQPERKMNLDRPRLLLMSTMCARRSVAAMVRWCAAGTCVVALSCGPGTPTESELSLSGSSPFPDSVRASDGLPPLAGSAASRVLASDTVVQASLDVAPAYEERPMQLRLQLLVRDTSASILKLRTLPVAPCPFVLRLHRAQPASAMPV